MDNKTLKIYCDGAARGNPGPAGAGVVIISKSLKKYKKFLGFKTNNQAEYGALIFALNMVRNDYPKVKEINFYLDSELVVHQLNGKYKVKNEKLGVLLVKIKNKICTLNISAHFYHIPRARNHQADLLANQAIDEKS